LPADQVSEGLVDGTRAGIGRFGRVLVARLTPGEDVLPALDRLLRAAGMSQAVVFSGVASLQHATVRNIWAFPGEWPITPDQRRLTTFPGPLEILALQGNVAPAPDGSLVFHVHAEFSVGTPAGMTYGGHLMDDTIVGTTAEIYLAELTGIEMRRTPDPVTKNLEIELAGPAGGRELAGPAGGRE
jgi:predicted DNA-binding protein with PD1-like motif